ncbi:hypothetical protein J2S66_002599 [Saccharothrix longispora]|uniref:Uncharacterized protein n=1 Tax=Saccharothrix longispora TaxID=33920 RepID=A0ABU1PU94_9PSEU|nr:hypothetical protein [Saccharothrix longispora]
MGRWPLAVRSDRSAPSPPDEGRLARGPEVPRRAPLRGDRRTGGESRGERRRGTAVFAEFHFRRIIRTTAVPPGAFPAGHPRRGGGAPSRARAVERRGDRRRSRSCRCGHLRFAIPPQRGASPTACRRPGGSPDRTSGREPLAASCGSRGTARRSRPTSRKWCGPAGSAPDAGAVRGVPRRRGVGRIDASDTDVSRLVRRWRGLLTDQELEGLSHSTPPRSRLPSRSRRSPLVNGGGDGSAPPRSRSSESGTGQDRTAVRGSDSIPIGRMDFVEDGTVQPCPDKMHRRSIALPIAAR